MVIEIDLCSICYRIVFDTQAEIWAGEKLSGLLSQEGEKGRFVHFMSSVPMTERYRMSQEKNVYAG